MSRRKDELQIFQECVKQTPLLEGREGLCCPRGGPACPGLGQNWVRQGVRTQHVLKSHLDESATELSQARNFTPSLQEKKMVHRKL